MSGEAAPQSQVRSGGWQSIPAQVCWARSQDSEGRGPGQTPRLTPGAREEAEGSQNGVAGPENSDAERGAPNAEQPTGSRGRGLPGAHGGGKRSGHIRGQLEVEV